jgi:AcrR family transcriptional regulator
VGHREQLLAAARRLLEERGYAHITARELVSASDTNLASIGYHFGSKAGLLNAAIELSFHDWAEQLAGLVMSDTAATPLQRAAATWVASLEALPARRSMLQSYVEALAQGLRVPELRTQLAAHYARARTMVAELVAHTLGEGIRADDARCRAVASLVIAACDGLAVQWLLDPDDAPDPEALADGLAAVLSASLPEPAGGLTD